MGSELKNTNGKEAHMKPHRHLFARTPLSAKVKAEALVLASLLVTGAWAGGCAGHADISESMSSDPAAPSAQLAPRAREGVATLHMEGIAISPEQIEALKKARADASYLSAEQAREVIKATGGALPLSSPQSSGTDSSTGDCSYIDLWGDSDGNYRFNQAVFPEVGQPAVGDVTISTDGWVAAEAYHDLAFAGDYQHFEGALPWTGIDPEATNMDGWMVTTGGNFCTGELDAVWE
jgi:hypothetical protein